MKIQILVWKLRGGQIHESELLASKLNKFGTTRVIETNNNTKYIAADINIHSSEIALDWITEARYNILIPNQEQHPLKFSRPQENTIADCLGALKLVDLILTKTKYAQELYSQHSLPAQYLGMISKDRYLPIPKKKQFLLVAGDNHYSRDIDVVLKVWRENPALPKLTIHTTDEIPNLPNNVELSRWKGEEELNNLFSEHQFHICPSRAEGFGHYIVEGMSTKAVVITPDAPPMNEHVTNKRGLLFETHRTIPGLCGHCQLHYARVRNAVNRALRMDEGKIKKLGENARKYFLGLQPKFEDNLRTIWSKICH